MSTSIAGNVTFQQGGTVTFRGGCVLPPSVVGNDQVSAVSPIGAAKVEHQYMPILAQPHGTAAVADRRVVHVARSAGTVEQFRAGPVVPATGDSTVTVDLRKNGTTVLSSGVLIESSTAAYAVLSGAIASASYVAGDVLEVVIAVSAGTGTLPQGVWGQATLREAA